MMDQQRDYITLAVLDNEFQRLSHDSVEHAKKIRSLEDFKLELKTTSKVYIVLGSIVGGLIGSILSTVVTAIILKVIGV